MYFKSYIVCLFTYIDQLLCLATDQLIDVKWGHGTPLSIQSQVGHFYTVPFIEAFGCKVTASILFTARSKEDRIIIGAFILSMGIIRMEMGDGSSGRRAQYRNFCGGHSRWTHFRNRPTVRFGQGCSFLL